jgi:hypothetical protein
VEVTQIRCIGEVRETERVPVSRLQQSVRLHRGVMTTQLYNRFFKVQPRRHEMLALVLNPCMDLEKLLGPGRAMAARDILESEIRTRGAQMEKESLPASKAASLPADGEGLARASKKARVASLSLLESVTEEYSFIDDMPMGELRDEATAFFHLTPAMKQEGFVIFVDEDGTPTGRRAFDTLLFWGRMELEFPIAHRVARASYSVMATEANSERAFSAAGFTLSDYRTSLSTEHMQWLMMIERNQEFLPSAHEVKAAYIQQHGQSK